VHREDIKIEFEGEKYTGKLVCAKGAQKKPLVLVCHNYAGLKFFDEHQAEYMARLGYVGLAIDMYGDSHPPESRLYPDEDTMGERAMAHFKICFQAMENTKGDPKRLRLLIQAWMDAGSRHESVDSSCKPCLIGYCYGGLVCFEAIRGGLPVAGVVSFHGVYQTGGPVPPHFKPFLDQLGVNVPECKRVENSYNTTAACLVENGMKDAFSMSEFRDPFVKEMCEAGVDLVWHDYAHTDHGFALPKTLGAPGHLSDKADRRSTENMLGMFRTAWPDVVQSVVEFNAAGTRISSAVHASAGPK
jgi:dienelactone hydrolase